MYAAMSLIRSPPKSISDSSSTPDLSTIFREALEAQITFRKRRQPDRDCSCNSDMKDLRIEIARITGLVESSINANQKTLDTVTEMKTKLTDFKASNEQNFSSLSNNVHEVKKQINEIQESMTNLTLEQNQIKSQITTLEQKIIVGEEKMRAMASDLTNLKTTDLISSVNQTSENDQMLYNEQIIKEVQERNSRQRNIILAGIEEQISTDLKERISLDMAKVINILTTLNKDLPTPVKTFRIGKYDVKKNRSIKVCFNAYNVANQLLRIKS